MIKLKACPYCGGNNLAFRQLREPIPDFEGIDHGDYGIVCQDCWFAIQTHKSNLKPVWERRKWD